ncbi:hypothetical protein NEPAR03_2361 [Nematocida parisii]|nr:hypothetical protein NEPAR03_2361 [Nematocida parisii]
MFKVQRITQHTVKQLYNQNTYSIHMLIYSIILYINNIFICKLVYNRIILSVHISEYVIIIISTGLLFYDYKKNNYLTLIKEIPIKGILYSKCVDEYIILCILDGNRAISTIYNTKLLVEYRISNSICIKNYVNPVLSVIERGKNIHGIEENRICVEYSDHKVYLRNSGECFTEISTEIFDKGILKSRKTVRNIFIDRRNLLRITPGQITHIRISTHRNILAEKTSYTRISETSNGLIIYTEGVSGYNIYREEYKYILEVLNPRDEVDLKESEKDRKHSKEIVFGEGLPSVILTPVLYAYITEKYIHQLLYTGTVEVFIRNNENIEYVRSFGPVSVHGLTDFYCFSTYTSSLVVLVYENLHFKVVEYSYKAENCSSLPAPDGIVDVMRFRKDIVIKCDSGYAKYSLNKKKVLEQMDLDVETGILHSFDAPNMNVQHSPVIFTKSNDNIISVHWRNSILVKDSTINNFYLLHRGYIYSKGFRLILTKEEISFPFTIYSLSVYNTAERSTVLVYLSSGSIHLLSVVNGSVIGRLELYHKISCSCLRMLSLDSFLCITGNNTLTVFGGDEYIYPILRVKIPGMIEDVSTSQNNILVVTDNNDIYCLDKIDIRNSTYTDDPSLINVVPIEY